MIIAYIMVAVFTILGIIFLLGKGSWLIAGYNTASAKEKEKYNEKSLCRSMGVMFLLLSIIIGAMCYVNTDQFALIMMIPFILVIIIELIFANKFCYKK